MEKETRSAGIRIEDSQDIDIDSNDISRYGDGISVSRTTNLRAKDNIIVGLGETELDEIRNMLVGDIEEIINEAKKGNNSKLTHLVNFVSTIGSGAVLGYLKLNGYIK